MFSFGDGFKNNQFVGTWKSYKNKVVKKCHWGDYRIPDCGDLDIGVGDISINKKYVRNGWQDMGLFLKNSKTPAEVKIVEWWK